MSDFEWNKIKNFNPRAIVINGPAKSLNLLNEVLGTETVENVYFNIDNDTDFEIIKNVSNSKLRVGLRVYLNAEGIWNRFGYDVSSRNLVDKINVLKEKLTGMHFHFSTNNFKLANYESILTKIKNLLEQTQIKLEYLDIGGGLPAANEFLYSQEIYKKLPNLIANYFPNVKIISEAGRNIVADAMSLESAIISKKKVAENRYQINIDTNIMHVPCFYEKKFWLEYITLQNAKNKDVEIEVCGNSCMQIDKFADSILIGQTPSVGDKIIIHNIGAYSHSQASKFLTPVPEVEAI